MRERSDENATTADASPAAGGGENAATRRTVIGRRDESFPGVLGLITANVALFVLEEWWGGSEATQVVARMGGATGRLIEAGELGRLLGAGYLHFGLEHLVNNLAALWIFGRILEVAVGTSRFLVLYSITLLCGFVAQYALVPDALTAGASAGTFGIVGATLVLYTRRRWLLPPFSRVEYAIFLGVFLGASFLFSESAGVALPAHVGGAAGGALGIWALLATRGLPPTEGTKAWPDAQRWIYRAAATAAILISVGSIVHSSRTYRPWLIRDRLLGVVAPIGDGAVVLEVPSLLLDHAEVHAEGDWIATVYGDLLFDPIIVRAGLGRYPGPPVAPEARREVLWSLSRSLMAAVGEGETLHGEPTMTTVGNHPWLVLDTHTGGLLTQRWLTLMGDLQVHILIGVADDAPMRWIEAADRVVRTVRLADRPRG